LSAAEKWESKLLRAPDVLERFPEIGAIVEDGNFPGLREILVRPYRIIYRIDDDVCHILHVVHGSRDLRRILDPENLP
jgi:plasmid stabilization system protein ParE